MTTMDATLRVMIICGFTQGNPPRVQPWAEGCNPVGIVVKGIQVRFGDRPSEGGIVQLFTTKRRPLFHLPK